MGYLSLKDLFQIGLVVSDINAFKQTNFSALYIGIDTYIIAPSFELPEWVY